MDFILCSFQVDYIILVPYDNIKKVIDLENIEIYHNENLEGIDILYDKTKIDSCYLTFEDFSIKNKNNNFLGDSTNELLKEPRKFFNEREKEKEKEKNKDKDESTTIRRINTESGNGSFPNNNKLFEENDINQVNINNEKLSINKINNNNNNKNIYSGNNDNEDQKDDYDKKSLDKDIDEFHQNEKFHNIGQKYYRHLSLKDLPITKISLNKKNEEKKNNNIEENENENEKDKSKENKNNENENENEKKENEKDEKELENEEIEIKNGKIKEYLFNDSKLTIDLSSFEGEEIKPIGLINPSIYCFMICILQALLSIPELNFYFLSKLYSTKSLNKSKYENQTILCDIFHDFVKSYLLGKKYIEIPKGLKGKCIELLGGMRMHDCQEFLVCFLEALQEELNTKEKYNIPENASMELKWILYRKANSSFIDSIFTGLMRSTVQCKKCNYKSYTFDPFIDLSVSINKYKNLEKCLKQYFENEKMDCEYKCDKCKQVSKVSKLII